MTLAAAIHPDELSRLGAEPALGLFEYMTLIGVVLMVLTTAMMWVGLLLTPVVLPILVWRATLLEQPLTLVWLGLGRLVLAWAFGILILLAIHANEDFGPFHVLGLTCWAIFIWHLRLIHRALGPSKEPSVEAVGTASGAFPDKG